MPDAGAALPAIVAHARAGAIERAWAMFTAGGLDRIRDDASVLAIKGRLLKDRAQRAPADQRAAEFAAAADAYASAAAIEDATYPLINAATLALLAGDSIRSAVLARQVLERLDQSPDEPETPYYRAATKAEAALLLRDEAGARTGLREAVSLAPRAWEDHASTLRQFGLILSVQGSDPAWLDLLRPPRSLHFGGHMSFRGDGLPQPLVRDIATALANERIGFGFGALAAGADILVAEALLERGAELHLLLPGGRAAFAALSVDPFGTRWRQRFDAVLRRADTVRAISPIGVQPDRAMIELADEVAMGAAIANARRLASEPVQLLVVDASGSGLAQRSVSLWARQEGRRQCVLRAPREVDIRPTTGLPHRSRSLAVLAIPVAAGSPADRTEALVALRAALASPVGPALPPSFTGEIVLAAYEDPGRAAAAAVAAVRVNGVEHGVGAHYGICDLIADPFSGEMRASGRAPAIARAAAVSALPDTVCVSDDFALSLEVVDPRNFRVAFVGELNESDGAAPIGLYALSSL